MVLKQEDVWANSPTSQKAKPGASKVAAGFAYAEKPKHETFNWMLNLITNSIMENQQNGIPVYSKYIQYKSGGLCLVGPEIWQAQKDTTNVTPAPGVTEWAKYADSITSVMGGQAIVNALNALGVTLDLDVKKLGGIPASGYVQQSNWITAKGVSANPYVGFGIYRDNKILGSIRFPKASSNLLIINGSGYIATAPDGSAYLYGSNIDKVNPKGIATQAYVASAMSKLGAGYLSKTEAANTYLSKKDASTGYLSKSAASSTYVSKTYGDGRYIKKSQMKLVGDKLYITL